VFRCSPVISFTHLFLPPEPDLTRFFCKKIFFLKAPCFGKFQGSCTDKQYMIGPLHHKFCHRSGCFYVLKTGYSTRGICLSIHKGSIELNNSSLIRQPSVTDTCIFGINLNYIRSFFNCINRIASIHQNFPACFHRLPAGLICMTGYDKRPYSGSLLLYSKSLYRGKYQSSGADADSLVDKLAS